MAHKSSRLLWVALVSLYCLAQCTYVIAGDFDRWASKIDTDLFLEDEGSGDHDSKYVDSEMYGSGNGYDDEDTKIPVQKTPKESSGPFDITGGLDMSTRDDTDDLGFGSSEGTNTNTDVFNRKEETRTSFFSQPGILAAIICGAIVGLLCAILLVMFIVYRMRKKDEGSYVLDDSKRTASTYGKSKEFFA